MTRPGVILGTAAYMSPEQAKGKSVDKRADIWAFGCILFECLTGKKAFEGETVTETLAAVLRGEPDWQKLPDSKPSNLRFVLRRCLEKERNRRLRDAGDVKIEIEEILDFSEATLPVKQKRLWLAWSVAIIFIIISAILFCARFYNKPIGVAQPVPLQISLPNIAPTPYGSSFALSPDGTHLAFISVGSNGDKNIQIRAINSQETHTLQGTESQEIYSLFWSYDSRFLAFDTGGELKKINISNGQINVICNFSSYALGGDWNHDDVILFGTMNEGIMRVSAEGGSASPLTKLNRMRQEISHVYPSFLPDGRHFLYFIHSAISENRGLYAGSLDSKPEKQDIKQIMPTRSLPFYVLSQGSRYGQLLFLDEQTLMAQAFDEKHLELKGDPQPIAARVEPYGTTLFLNGYFSSSKNGILAYVGSSYGSAISSYELVWKDQTGKLIGSAAPPRVYENFQLSKDEKKVAFGTREDAWVMDLSRRIPIRLTYYFIPVGPPLWSPDGQSVAYSYLRSGRYAMCLKASSGTGPEELLVESDENYIWGTDWSDDGRFILYQILSDKTGWDLWIFPLSSDKKPFAYLKEPFNEQIGVFSPDGKWIAYVSNETGDNEVYVQSFPLSDVKTLISTGGGTEPRWSKNGKELFYVTPERILMSVPIEFQPNFEADLPKPLMTILRHSNVNNYAVSGDGRRFLVENLTENNTIIPINILVNWQASLKK